MVSPWIDELSNGGTQLCYGGRDITTRTWDAFTWPEQLSWGSCLMDTVLNSQLSQTPLQCVHILKKSRDGFQALHSAPHSHHGHV